MRLIEENLDTELLNLIASFEEEIQLDRDEEVEEMEMLFDDMWGG